MEKMKKIAITTDTNSGMMPYENEAQGIFVLPMPFIVDDVAQLESVDLSREDFYEKLVAGSNITTSQPSVGEVVDFWTEILKEYDEIIHVPTSSLLSASFATAKAQAETFNGRVHLVDNRRLSVCLKSSVFDAAKLRDEGKSAEEIVQTLESMGADYAIYFSIETMQYLKKGGRISPAAAAIGSILKLRPVLCLSNGKLDKYTIAKSMTKAKIAMKDAIKNDLNGKFKEYAEKGEMRLVCVYGNNPEESKAFEEEIKTLFPNIPFLYNDPMSLSIACHTGPGVVSVGLVRVLG
ncbi:MAG: DegV family protein [Clostridia bacterium]|nr:DegV family protein [Clostridia bacterium]